jgi:hypothetical protein
VSLTSSDILGLDTTPVLLVAAPGAGFMTRFTNAALTFRNVTSPYTAGTGTALFFTDKSGLSTSGTFPSAFQLAANRTIQNITNTAGTVTPVQVENQNLVIATPTAFVGGDGTALLTVDYLILPCA